MKTLFVSDLDGTLLRSDETLSQFSIDTINKLTERITLERKGADLMGIWIIMLLTNLLIPVIMIFAGYMMYKHPPNKINGIYGYRTRRSMKNDETWKFAHDYCGRLWIKLGFVLIIPTIIAMLPFVHGSVKNIAIVTLIAQFIQVLVLILSVIPVESALKKNFEDDV